MTTSASAIPDEIYYHLVEKPQTVDALMRELTRVTHTGSNGINGA